MTGPHSPANGLPRRWPWLVRRFQYYASRYVRRHFHAVWLSRSSCGFPAGNQPLLIVLNHPSWWDPLICTILSRSLDREHYAAIDAMALQKYRFFAKLGFVGIDTQSLRGASVFLRTGQAILSQPQRVFWVTAQGRFTDVRQRPLQLQPGVGHLAARLNGGFIVPLAVEYTFWNERTPEALVRIGQALNIADHPHRSGKQWLAEIEAALTTNLDILSAEVMRRDPTAFVEILRGKVGIGGIYDHWRRLKAWLRGQRFDPAHDARPQGAES
ncbi:MAG: lysophospholipid acyltransferase family protein [Gemmataceae bacterium]|nr:lysophospholipid acyltransferase family protein [Gemmata sp.]MDW8196511.1 lysophospholipid acyltransferase family protein [Gemmataceae bacterium]